MRSIKEIEEKLYLADDFEKIKYAEEISKKSIGKEKKSFVIFFIPVEKENVLLDIQRLGCIIEKQSNDSNCVTALMTSEQLVAIKKLDSIERIEKREV